MAYLAPIHRPSSVRHALKLNFLAPDEECLVIAKANRLEIYRLKDDGLSLAYSKAIYGKVTMLDKLCPASSQTDHLFVGTDRYMYFTLSWDAQRYELRTEKSYVDLADKSARDSQTGDRCLVDPTRRFMTLELLEGVVTVIPISQKGKKKTETEVGLLEEPMHARIPELFVRSSAFLMRKSRSSDRPRIALLFEDSFSKLRLRIRQLNYTAGTGGEGGSVALEQSEGPNEVLDLGASHLIPIPEPAYGLLILGETKITYYNDFTAETITEPLKEATIFVAWERIDNQRFVLADDYGKLFLLMLNLDDGDSVSGWKLDMIGETSRASTLTYLDAGLIFVGSHQGDSQLIRIIEGSTEVVQTFPNVAPILDFTIMDMGSRSGDGQANEFSSGQARIVAGSGAFNDGSLRSVRSGVGLEDLGTLAEMEHITNLFSLKSNSRSEYVDTLVVSFMDETRIFLFSEDGDVEEVTEFKGMQLQEPTLSARSLPRGRLLQVTPSSARLIDVEDGMVVSESTPGAGQTITAADANDRYAILSIGGLKLLVIDLQKQLRIHSQKELGAEAQASCISIPDFPEDICVAGFWRNSEVSILIVDTLEPVHTTMVAEDSVSVPRSAILTRVLTDQPPTLFVAMADGNVVTYSMDPTTFELTGKKSTVLGTQQADLKVLPRGDGLFNVFAICEHPSLIYGSEGRIVFSAVTAEKATCVCSLNAAAYPGAVAICTADKLGIAIVDKERTTHVQTLPVKETVRRLAYSPTLKAFGLGTIRRSLENGAEVVHSNFRLADEVLFKELDSHQLNADELVESVMRCELDDGTGELADRFVVGTAYLDDEHDDAVRGRILVFEVTEDRHLKLVTELAVKGACRCLGMVDGKIVAALIKTVVVYSFTYQSPGSPILSKAGSYRTSTAPIDLYVSGRTIVIADLMKSISVVEYKAGHQGLQDTLTEVARHFQTMWSTAVAEVADGTYLESDAEGNLTVMYRETEGITEDDQRRLKVSSEILLGEMVNRIRRIDVPTTPNATVTPRAFLATVEGSIYLFALIVPDRQNLLITLQANLAEHVRAPGGIPFAKYRAFHNQTREEDEPYRFVDGDLIERFLDCPPEVQEQVVKGLDVSVDDAKALVEGLRRLH